MIIYTQVFDNVTDELAEQYEAEFEENGDDDVGSDNDSQSGSDSEEEDVFDSIVDRERRRILFDLLHIVYHFIRRYKAYQFNEITQMVAEKFEVWIHLYLFLSRH